MTKQLITDLKLAGFKQNESEIYLYLLQNGISTPPQIAKGTSIARTNCYRILNDLREKSVIDEQTRGKRTVYVARPPEFLKLNLENKLENLTRILPDLAATYVIQKNKPTFRFYDGWREVQQIYNLTLSAKEIYATGSTDKLETLDQTFFASYITKIEKNKIIFHDLLPYSNQKSTDTIKHIRPSLHAIAYIPEKYRENLTDLLIWDDNIALIALEEPIFGTVITNEPLAQTLRTLLAIIVEKVSTTS